MSAVEVVWRGPLFGVAGYAQEARELVLGLDALGVRMRVDDNPLGPHACPLDTAVEHRLRELQTTQIGETAVRIEHGFPTNWTKSTISPTKSLNGGRRIGRTTFETDRVPREWVPLCNALDELWVPSEFNVETFSASGVDERRLRVVPGPLRVAAWQAEGRFSLPRHAFVFLSVFDWSLRKGYDVLLAAYCAEFRRDEDVALVLKVHSSYGLTAMDLRQLVRRFVVGRLHVAPSRAPAFVVVDRILSGVELADLYRAADCFVLPTRGEGWGRPFLEAMASGLPVIGTRWGGHTAFMDDRNSYLVEVEELVAVPESGLEEAPMYRGHRWAEPSIEHLRALMRRAYERRDEAREKAQRARADVQRYDTERVCADLFARLVELAE